MLRKDEFLDKYQITDKELIKNNIDWDEIEYIYEDFMMYRKSYETAHLLDKKHP